ncbi:MAG: hotdog fold thioesterase [Dokdonella sp.]
MTIWKTTPDIDTFNTMAPNSILDVIGIRFTEFGDDWLRGTMPVDHRTHQPYGLLHGGASVVLAETLASVAATCCVEPGEEMAVGLDINANHIRAVTTGVVTGTAKAVHIGRSTQVWEIRIVDDRERLVCISRITLAVVAPRPLKNA